MREPTLKDKGSKSEGSIGDALRCLAPGERYVARDDLNFPVLLTFMMLQIVIYSSHIYYVS
jgi:hypothetical protein